MYVTFVTFNTNCLIVVKTITMPTNHDNWVTLRKYLRQQSALLTTATYATLVGTWRSTASHGNLSPGPVAEQLFPLQFGFKLPSTARLATAVDSYVVLCQAGLPCDIIGRSTQQHHRSLVDWFANVLLPYSERHSELDSGIWRVTRQMTVRRPGGISVDYVNGQNGK